jgi:hypothetical protein
MLQPRAVAPRVISSPSKGNRSLALSCPPPTGSIKHLPLSSIYYLRTVGLNNLRLFAHTRSLVVYPYAPFAGSEWLSGEVCHHALIPNPSINTQMSTELLYVLVQARHGLINISSSCKSLAQGMIFAVLRPPLPLRLLHHPVMTNLRCPILPVNPRSNSDQVQ